jgi:organic hydroperoxide reductase OsmC/OhrA
MDARTESTMKEHRYSTHVTWTGNIGEGTANYRVYSRDHVISIDGKPEIPASSDPSFRGDPARYNPEELLVASLSSCHMLWYLHLCAVNKIVVTAYKDQAVGTLSERPDGSGEFLRVTLKPRITISSGNRERALALHHEAHEFCFIANSVKFPVEVEPEVLSTVD